MKKLLLAFAFATTLSVTATIGQAQEIPDPRVADLVQAGKIRVGLFLPQFSKDAVTGELKGRAVCKHLITKPINLGVHCKLQRPSAELRIRALDLSSHPSDALAVLEESKWDIAAMGKGTTWFAMGAGG